MNQGLCKGCSWTIWFKKFYQWTDLRQDPKQPVLVVLVLSKIHLIYVNANWTRVKRVESKKKLIFFPKTKGKIIVRKKMLQKLERIYFNVFQLFKLLFTLSDCTMAINKLNNSGFRILELNSIFWLRSVFPIKFNVLFENSILC